MLDVFFLHLVVEGQLAGEHSYAYCLGDDTFWYFPKASTFLQREGDVLERLKLVVSHKITWRLLCLTETRMTCDVCLDLDRCTKRDGKFWEILARDDLDFEYSLHFASSELEVSARSGCPSCAIVWNGLELMSRKLFLFDNSCPNRGRLILHPGCPLEVELIDENDSPRARLQYYTLEGLSSNVWQVRSTR
jgi:hypothetical protein